MNYVTYILFSNCLPEYKIKFVFIRLMIRYEPKGGHGEGCDTPLY